MEELHDRRFPGESEAYRAAREKLLNAEADLRRRIEEVAALRRKLPLGGQVAEDYAFQEIDIEGGGDRTVRLSELFAEGKDSLIVYGFMYGPDWNQPCPLCTSITDGSNGVAPHLQAATNFAVVAKAGPERLLELARARGWHNLRLLSSLNNRFNRDYFTEYEGDHGNHHPMINVFTKRGGRIHHFWASEVYWIPEPGMQPRHADLIWPLWNYLDMTPEGRGDFMPRLNY